MKEYSAEEFLFLPSGTIFLPSWTGLRIKLESITNHGKLENLKTGECYYYVGFEYTHMVNNLYRVCEPWKGYRKVDLCGADKNEIYKVYEKDDLLSMRKNVDKALELLNDK